MKSLSISLTALLAITLSGCISFAPGNRIPEKVSELPDAYAQKSKEGDYTPAQWWHAFEDPTLDLLVGKALSDNLDIAEAAARVRQASAQARLARAGLLPQLQGGANGSFSSTPVAGSAFEGLGGLPITRIENETYALSLGASYELDLFGRVRGDLAAARADALAAEYDFRTVQISAASETISAYFEIVDTRRQIELTLLTAELLTERVAQSEERFRRGLIDSFELYQQRQDLRTTQSSLSQLESALDNAEGRLAVLVREYSGSIDAMLDKALKPRLAMDDVPTGLPIALLNQRPDIAAAAARLESSRQRIGARRAERFPSLSLSATPSTQSANPGGAFDIINNWALQLAANIVAPIFDGGRISAQIKTERAVYDERAAAYARTVLDAYREVSSALKDYQEDRQRYTLITDQLTEAELSLDLQARRFESGVGSYSAYLDALRAVYQVETTLSSAARDVVLARLGVHRALGGDWTEKPVLPSEVKMKKIDRNKPDIAPVQSKSGDAE